MSSKAGCGFRAAHALKISAAKVWVETLAKQVVASRKAKMRGIPRRSGAENSCDESFGRNFSKARDGVEEGRLAGCRRSPMLARATASSASKYGECDNVNE